MPEGRLGGAVQPGAPGFIGLARVPGPVQHNAPGSIAPGGSPLDLQPLKVVLPSLTAGLGIWTMTLRMSERTRIGSWVESIWWISESG